MWVKKWWQVQHEILSPMHFEIEINHAKDLVEYSRKRENLKEVRIAEIKVETAWRWIRDVDVDIDVDVYVDA